MSQSNQDELGKADMFILAVTVFLAIILSFLNYLSYKYGYDKGAQNAVESYRAVCEPNRNTKLYYELRCDK